MTGHYYYSDSISAENLMIDDEFWFI